jgi:cytochrome b
MEAAECPANDKGTILNNSTSPRAEGSATFPAASSTTPAVQPAPEADTTRPETARVLVWDVPLRLFHWLMVLSFSGAYLTAESERWRQLHVTLGYTMAGLVGFRIVWGLIGTRHARFARFVRGPRAVARYAGTLLRGQPEHHTGHNPAGALAILALLGLSVAVTGSGWAVYHDIAGNWLGEVHESAANIMLAIVVTHVVGVLVASWLHQENLTRAMVTGYKRGKPGQGIGHPWRSVAALMLIAVAGFWWLQWQSAFSPSGLNHRAAATAQAGERDHDAD